MNGDEQGCGFLMAIVALAVLALITGPVGLVIAIGILIVAAIIGH